MNDFPNVNNSQIVLVRALVNTGQVLDEGFNLKINEEQNVYSIFESIEDVEVYVNSVFNERDDVEIWAYDSNNVMLKCYNK